MNKLVRPVSAVALAAAIAAAISILPTLSDPVDASTPIVVAMAAAPVPVSNKCAEQAWPYIDADCLRDNRKVEGQAKPASRTVTADRKMAAAPQGSFVQENRFTASTALRPPNANEFDSAASTFMPRALFGTQSISQFGSGPR